jgi:hypothetical protein
MSNDDFQERLQRITRNSSQSPAPGRAGAVSEPARGPNLVLMVVAVFVILLGSGLIRFANESYETLRADGGVGLSLAVGLGAFATIIFGIVLFWRSFRKRPAQVSYVSEPLPAAGGARRGPLLFGLALGFIACFSMFMTSAARLLNPATDNVVSAFAFLGALTVTFVALLIGIIGLFRRGSALRRVPLYYLAGAILTYATFRFFYIDLRSWPWFASLVL